MKKLSSIVYLFIVFLACFVLQAGAQNLSNRGREFWVGYGHHQEMEGFTPTNGQDMILYFSAEQTANVRVTINGTAWSANYIVPGGTVVATTPMPKAGAVDARLISFPCAIVPVGTPCGGEGVFPTHGIHIESDVPIVAYAHIYAITNSGASMLMPVETWGYSYITLNSKQSYAANCFSWAYVIAQHDNTLVEIIPAATTRLGKTAGVPFTVLLQKGQIYQFMAGPEGGSLKPELTGTKIKSIANAAGACYPIAVFAGSSRTTNPASCGSGGGDNDNQQCFPSQAWGKRYLTAPTSSAPTPSAFGRNTYKIAVKDPSTVVRLNGTPLAGMVNNVYTFESNEEDYIEADKPIMVAQFMTGGASCLGGGSSTGDPEMMYLSPIEQGIKRTGFYRNDRFNINVNYLTLIIPTAGVSSLTINGSNAFDHTYPHDRLPGYTVVVKRWAPAGRAQVVVQSDSAFTAITYGMGGAESYGYNAGTLINNLNAVGSIRNTSDTSAAPSHPFTCTNTPVKLSVLLGYPTPPTRLVWQLSQVGGGLTPNSDVTVNGPVPAGTQIVNGVVYTKYELPGTYTFSTADTFRIPILATHPSIENCNNTEQVYYDIIVKDKPTSNFNFTHSGCVLDSVQFTGISPAANGYTINQWLWTFPDATTATRQGVNKLFTSPGSKTINLKVVSVEGCVGDTSRDIIVYPKPIAAIAPAGAVCEGTAVILSGNASYTGTAAINSYYWDFGDGTVLTVATNAPQTHTYAAPGNYTVKHVAGVTTACVSDTARLVVTVRAKPNATFTYPAGCLPATGVVQFTSTASAPDGQAVTGHVWNFGDPASGAANTSTIANPTHTYPTFGNYTISYRATTANGCFKDTTVNATFNLAPTFNYPALATVCGNISTSVSVATASVPNGVPGAGGYYGPGTSLAGTFNPTVAGPGSHVIWYVFTTTAVCKDSVSQTISVNAVPDASFAITTSGCLPASGTVPFNYTGAALPGQTYLWNFGDPASGAANTSTLASPSHNFATGTFTITLSVSANGCTKDSVVTNTFNLTPSLSYPALPAVCESVTGTVSVATAAVTNNVPGTGVYSGTGVNAAGNFSPSVAGAGTHVITYTFTSSGNCVSTVTSSITVNPKPTANFTYPAVACLPSTGLAQFTYTGTMSAGQTYLWNFGDPAGGANNSSTAANPTHNYTNTGSYTVTVTVTNSNGCTDDHAVTTTFSVTPALAYPALTAVCESVAGSVSVATATVSNNVLGTGVYSGPAVNAAGNFSPSVAGPGTHTITYTFTSTGNCISTITSTITVNPKPTVDLSYPTVPCLPASGLAQFTYTGTMSAGQTYAWNFGDPASGANNTSTAASPTHNYTNTGSYTVTVTVTNSNGCTDDHAITTTFSVTPALAYPPLAAVCESVAGTVPVATASVTNNVSGTGVYSGPGVTTAGNFNPSVAGPGTHTITYTFTSTGNCVSTINSTISVTAKPGSAFTITPGICLGQQALITDNSSMPTGSISSWQWFFGDGNTATYTNNTPFNYLYSSYGNYTVKLVTTSAAGCSSDTAIQTITVNAVPVTSFTMPSSVCMPAGTVSFTNTTTVAGGSSLTYSWNFGDGNTSTAVSPSHVYGSSGSYTVNLRTTGGNGCFKDSAQVFDRFFDKPIASFDVNNKTICQGADNIFTDMSTAPNSTIKSRLWNFGDGTTSTVTNPVKRFTNPGQYVVTLVVTNNENCVSDSFSQLITVYLQPVVDAGPSFVVAQGTQLQFQPTANDSSATTSFLWSPATGLSDPSVLRPVLTAMQDQVYTLTATGEGNCTATDFLTVKILRPVKIPNAFSPNGDGTNDRWDIENLSDYTGVTVEVYNRYGQLLYNSPGYNTPWDGTTKGKPLPVATYYYIIQLKNGFKPLSGSVTIIR